MQVFFDKTLEKEFEKIYSKFKSIELKADEAYNQDLDYLKKRLQIFETCP